MTALRRRWRKRRGEALAQPRETLAELRALSPASNVLVHLVPGAFEIPLLVREAAAKGKVDAIVALGVILQGETAHAQHLGQAVTQALQQISLEHSVPVIHAVLSLQSEEQARKRCLEGELNRGTEAARAAFAGFAAFAFGRSTALRTVRRAAYISTRSLTG